MTRTARVSHFVNLQESGPKKTFIVHCDYPAHYRAEITVEAEDVVSACRSAIDASHTTDGWKSLDTEHPTYVSAIAEGADVNPWRFVPDGGDASVLPVPGLFSEVTACAGYAATGSEDLVDQIRIMIDAIGAEGTPTDHFSSDGPPVCNGAGPSRRHRDIRVEPHFNRSSKRGHVFVRRHLTYRSLPPERCGTWAAARPPQPQKSGPSCRFAAARTTPVFAVSLRFAPVRAPLIRPPRRCASGG
ncbi:hypothetical protein QLH51_04055 [Sphingomonas sp. 2R-10]|uniref:hypothetical protein n=1 Tax=Sphingomonas sp. 2R-10 TaxID=3045148 RepID=UPI0024B972DA|nr:hypothetical protein [Sphingomonas sp. 2R-10]MDJ0275977.1 hypothetical protein [Sphingomonas sp. 2R-10]